MQTEPEQWAVELWHAAYDSFENCATQSFGDDDKAAALTIQRAFEERERKLREQLARYEGGAGPDDWRECPGQCGESCCGYHDMCRQALKETPDAG